MFFLVCATGKSAQEMQSALEKRINNNKELELKNAAKEQAQITKIRLKNYSRRIQVSKTRSPITTHILDLAKGQAAANIQVKLEKLEEKSSWKPFGPTVAPILMEELRIFSR